MSCRRVVQTDTAPGDPQGLIAAGTLSGVDLTWNANTETDLAGYKVYRATTVGGSYSLISGGSAITTTSYTDTTGTAGTEYFYKVTAVDNAGNESPGSIVSATKLTADVTAPADPTGLSLTVAGATAVQLDWADNVEVDLDGYNVYRSTTLAGTYTKLNSSLILVSQYTDLNATAGSTWYYKVSAVDKAGNESGFATGNIAVPTPDVTAPAAPSGLIANYVSPSVVVMWTANSEPDLDHYDLYKQTDGGGFSVVGSSLTAATYTDSAVSVGHTYDYKAKAIDTSNNASGFSLVSTVTVSSSSGANDLSPFTYAGMMVPCAVFARGVNYNKYVETVDNTAKTVSISTGLSADFKPLANGSPEKTRYDWNWAKGKTNALKYQLTPGFNSAAGIDQPGTYTHQLTRTDINGVVDVFEVTKTYAPNSRTKVYCAANGDGSTSNPGTDITKPVNITRANGIIGGSNNIQLMLRNGDTFSGQANLLTIKKSNTYVTNYSDPASPSSVLPVVKFTGTPSGARVIIDISSTATNTVIENLQITSDVNSKSDFGIGNEGAGGTLIRNLSFSKFGRPIHCNDNVNTRYVLVQDVVVTDDNMRDNFCFVKGQDLVFINCTTPNSVNEHAIRLSNATRVLIYKCSLGNKDASVTGLSSLGDTVKSSCNCQQGMYYWISQNNIYAVLGTAANTFGSVQLGPLNGKGSGFYQETLQYVVFERNTTSEVTVLGSWGTLNVMIRNNIINKTGNACIKWDPVGFSSWTDTFGQSYSLSTPSDKFYFYNNTLISGGTTCSMFRFSDKMSTLEMKNNLISAPNLTKSDPNTCNVKCAALQTLNSFDRNVWALIDLFIVNGVSQTIAVWNGNSQVGADITEAQTLNGLYKPQSSSGSATYGRAIKGVWDDYYGTARNQSDTNWTAGAVQGSY